MNLNRPETGDFHRLQGQEVVVVRHDRRGLTLEGNLDETTGFEREIEELHRGRLSAPYDSADDDLGVEDRPNGHGPP